jgi:hypothetical protein
MAQNFLLPKVNLKSSLLKSESIIPQPDQKRLRAEQPLLLSQLPPAHHL